MGIKLNQSKKKADGALVGPDARRALCDQFLQNVDPRSSYSTYRPSSIDWMNEAESEKVFEEQVPYNADASNGNADYEQFQYDNNGCTTASESHTENAQYSENTTYSDQSGSLDSLNLANKAEDASYESYSDVASTYIDTPAVSEQQCTWAAPADSSCISVSQDLPPTSSLWAGPSEDPSVISISREPLPAQYMVAPEEIAAGIAIETAVQRSPEPVTAAQEVATHSVFSTSELADAVRLVEAFQHDQDQVSLDTAERAELEQMDDIVENFETDYDFMEDIPQTLEEIILGASVSPTPDAVPTSAPGISRTQRGTIEFIVHPTGTSITPKYNRCGILMGVDFNDGSRFVRSNCKSSQWTTLDTQGNVVDIDIVALSIDRRGSVVYSTADGAKVTIHPDGSITRKEMRRPA